MKNKGVIEKACNYLKYGKPGDYLEFDESHVRCIRVSSGVNTLPDIRFFDLVSKAWEDIEFAEACEKIADLVEYEFRFD